ncbi:MAG: hypothetical protein H6R14_1459 [Proteobacteria bacterium]|nr:hypothetical protein [Pseudomonadota bacterium]
MTILARLGFAVLLLAAGVPAVAQSILLDHRTATYGSPFPSSGTGAAGTRAMQERVLVTFNALPAEGEFRVIGPIDVHSRWFGGTSKSAQLLADKARSMGANAVVSSRVWLAPAFPVFAAPHGSGIAVRIHDETLLNSLADAASTWE